MPKPKLPFLEGLIELFEQHVEERGPGAAIIAVLGGITILVTLGFIPGGPGSSFGIRVAVLALLAVLVILLLIRVRLLRQRLSTSRVIGLKLANKLYKAGSSFDVVAWDETVHISRSGLTASKKVRLRATGATPVELVWQTHLGPFQPDQLSKRQRDRVQAAVFHVDDAGADGARYEFLHDWVGNDGKDFRIFVPFYTPLLNGSEISIRVEIDWPGYYQPLAHGQADEFIYGMHRNWDLFSLKLIFDKNMGIEHNLGVTCRGGLPVPRQYRDGDLHIVQVDPWTPPLCDAQHDLAQPPRTEFVLRLDNR